MSSIQMDNELGRLHGRYALVAKAGMRAVVHGVSKAQEGGGSGVTLELYVERAEAVCKVKRPATDQDLEAFVAAGSMTRAEADEVIGRGSHTLSCVAIYSVQCVEDDEQSNASTTVTDVLEANTVVEHDVDDLLNKTT